MKEELKAATSVPAMSKENGDQKVKRSRRKGGIKTMPFILANDMCEKLAMVGIARNMVNYFTKQMHMQLAKAANTVTNFNGTSSLTPLIGAFLADSYTGKFWTIASGSTIYLLGMICLTLTASLPKLRPPQCGGDEVCREGNSGQLAVLYLSLLLTAIGAGGIKPCVAAYGAEQFIEEDPRHAKKTGVYFNWYYFATGAATLIAATVLVYVQDNVGWGWGIAIPTICMALSILVFVVGYPIYRNLNPSGSPYVRLFQVSVAAFRKRKMAPVPNPELLYVDAQLDSSISTDGMLCHSEDLKFLDKAAIVTESDNLKQSTKPGLWRLSTVHRVEEVKLVIRMLPIWAAGILFTTSAVQQNTFSLQQANTMERHLTNSFQIPAASISVFVELSMLATLALYDRVLVRFARRYTGLYQGINCLQRMGIGLFLSIIATMVAGFVEVKRKQVAAATGLTGSTGATIPISAFWLVPQYSLHGIAEAFFIVGRLEFFYDQAPESMRSTTSALYFLSVAVGNYASTLLVTLVTKYSAGPDRSNWLPPHNLNRGKLENFYWLLTCLQGMNIMYYFVCAKMYTFKSLEARSKEQRHQVTEDLELSAM